METLGIITYDTNHLKTEQLLLRLAGRYTMRVYALPYVQRPARKVLFQHRPDQSAAAHPRDICRQYGMSYIPVESDQEIDNGCDIYLIAGAGILSAECLRGKLVLNCHPGVIPAAKGLDAFKWSIYHMLPLGVTLHYVDEQIDSGEVVTIIPTPVFPSDTLQTLARRHYENEIQTLSQFDAYLKQPRDLFTGIDRGERMRRMKVEQQAELPERFERYKQRMLSLAESTYGVQMPPPCGHFEEIPECRSVPHDRRKAAAWAEEKRAYFAHGSSYVDEGCEIGEGTKIWHFSHIMKGCKIGKDCNIGQNVVISPGVVLGDRCKVQNNVSIYTGVVCEDGVFLGPSCVFTNIVNPRALIERKSEYQKTTLREGASIGANATIVCGHSIGRYALVGAGAVVTKDVPDHAMVYGCPAKVRGYVCRCGEQIKFSNLRAVCSACGKRYRMSETDQTVKEVDRHGDQGRIT